MPLVSVIIPVYNGAATIAEAIDSALGQTFRDLEVIVVDASSTDGTPKILEGYGDRITVVRQPKLGIAAGRNAGLRLSSAEYLAFLDCDDTWRPQMLERAVSHLNADPGCVLTFCDLAMVDSNGRELGASIIGPGLDHAPSLEEMLSQLWPIMPTAAVIRRSVLEGINGFTEELLSYNEDVYTFLLLRELGHFHYIPEQLGTWRFAHFPNPLKPRARDLRAKEIFERLMQEHFGVNAERLSQQRFRAPRSILGYIGLRALHRGDMAEARSAFIVALKLDPLRAKTYLRLMRTFLPKRIVAALSGRTSAADCSETGRKSA